MSLYSTKSVKDLMELLKQRGLDCKGRKEDLIDRLEQFDSQVNDEVESLEDLSSEQVHASDHENEVSFSQQTEAKQTLESEAIKRLTASDRAN
jgi:SAP domain